MSKYYPQNKFRINTHKILIKCAPVIRHAPNVILSTKKGGMVFWVMSK
jgi:hypothetical protein